MDLRFPRDYGGYRLTGLLGAGGTAEVYRAEVRAANGTVSEVAIRRIARGVSNDADTQRMLLEEARIWVSLKHPNIVRVLDIGQHDGDWFTVLELVDGASIDDLLRALGPIAPDEALAIAHRTALALAHAHDLVVFGKRMEVVHRDVKPANILVGANGSVKLTDFGIARAIDRLGRTAAGVVKGSLHFLSPEQVRKEPLDGRTDLFALGCTLHTMLTGEPLIDVPKDQVLRVLARGDVPPPPAWLPEKVRALLKTLAAPTPAGRPATAQAAAALVLEAMSPTSLAAAEAELAARIAKFKTATLPNEAHTSALNLSSVTRQSPKT